MTTDALEQKAEEFSQRVSTSHRVHADLYIGNESYTSVTAIVKAAYLAGLNEGWSLKSRESNR